ncbi:MULTISPECIES: DUF5996 family protein [unclassified Exiguobacterium]|uniref:DUF5996 family protein n=1 Tax=unclassified Exiguobacterium TaxID=2644629 RepID=UPI0020374E40|nr:MULTISPECIES: DUF5996 family protein [unclassified Exiguobacterium]
MHIPLHSEWHDTKLTLHLISQLLGKIRLQLAPPEPQWGHVSLPLMVQGFTTGLLFEGERTLQIDVDLLTSCLVIHVEDQTDAIPIESGKTIKSYHDDLFARLREHGIHVNINPKPQEMSFTGQLDTDETPLAYDAAYARKGLRLFQRAAHEQLTYLSKLRCRKIKPALFWGTFDVSSLVIYPIEQPFPEDKVIERVAFDEQFVEFGFWLGDDVTDRPSYFVLPYPFLFRPLPTETLKPGAAYYDAEKSEFFLPLDEATSGHVQDFLSTSFDILMREMDWTTRDHFFIPLKLEEERGK